MPPQGLFLVGSFVRSSSLCSCSRLGVLFTWATTGKGFLGGAVGQGVTPWTLAWTNQSISCPSTPFCGSGDATGLAREESPLAGALRCPPGNNREHPCHRHPLLHGHEGMCPAWDLPSGLGPQVLCGVPSDCWCGFQI